MASFSETHLASAIVWWLNYISAAGREYLIAERTIGIPATEYLERYFRDKIILEFDHPSLSQKKIDLYFNDLQNKSETVYEFKFVREDSTNPLKERKRIFNDLMRLYLYKGTSKKGYFLICGNQFHFNTSFQNLNLKGKYPTLTPRTAPTTPIKTGFFGEWFSFDLAFALRKIDLTAPPDTEYKKIYEAFAKDHADAYNDATGTKLIMPASINTNLVFLSEELTSSNIPQTFKIGIWEVT